MKNNNKVITYLDTYGNGGYTYADFVEYCKEENWDLPEDELKIPAEDSHEFWEWINGQIEWDVEDFFENLKYAKDVNDPCEVSGTLGLWWGNPTIEPKKFDTLVDAISACWDKADAVQVTLEDGVVYVKAMHHDGTNCFEIRPENGTYPEYLF